MGIFVLLFITEIIFVTFSSGKFEMYDAKFYADDTFRDCILKDDLEGAKQSRLKKGRFPVTKSEVKNAARAGLMACLAWLVEECGIKPDYVPIPYALQNGQYAAVLYLLKHQAPITAGGIRLLFDHYRFDITIPDLTVDQMEELRSYNINVSVDTTISLYIRIVSALCTTFYISLEYYCLFYMMIKLWWSWKADKADIDQIIRDTEFMVTHHSLSNPECLDHIYSTIILTDVNLPAIEIKSIDIKVIQRCLLDIHDFVTENKHSPVIPNVDSNVTVSNEQKIKENKYKISLNNFRKGLDRYPVKLDATYIGREYIKTVEELELLLQHLPCSINYLEQWFILYIQYNSMHFVTAFVNHISTNKYWSQFCSMEDILITIVYRRPNIFDMVIEASGWNTPIRWVACEKMYGVYSEWNEECSAWRKKRQTGYWSPLPQSVYEKYQNLKYKNLIDWSAPMLSDYTEKWIWIGMGQQSTYSHHEYIEHKINPLFENIRTLDDVNTSISYLYKHIRSPTACYFDIDNDIFYRDQQDCVIWALNKDGRVYIKDDDPYTISYVAKSIPEFLSHIYDDTIDWTHRMAWKM